MPAPTAPTTTTDRHRWRLRGKALVAACAAAAALGGLAGSASAANTTTKWYSIDQKPASTSSPAQFLTATSTGQVTLDRYQSGEWRQQWRPVYPEWPASPTVTGSGSNPLFDFFEAMGECIANWGCPFSGSAGRDLSPRKYVNRMYAACLSIQATGSVTTRVVVEPCGLSGRPAKRQAFIWDFPDPQVSQTGIPREYTELFGLRGGFEGQGRCLDSAGGGNSPGVNAAALQCGLPTNQPWRQDFRFLESGSATCKRNYPGTLCGLGAPVRSQP